jgi:hypothetical protein
MIQDNVFSLICEERERQIAKKGFTLKRDANHSIDEWLAIVVHEVGDLGNAYARCLWRSPSNDRAMRNALVKIAAVCVAALEAQF